MLYKISTCVDISAITWIAELKKTNYCFFVVESFTKISTADGRSKCEYNISPRFKIKLNTL